MNGMRPFEIVLIGVFGAVAIGALIAVMLYRASPEVEDVQFGDSVEIWGTFNQDTIHNLFADMKSTNRAFNVVSYTQKNPETFVSEIVDAIAEDKSPDLIVLPHEDLVSLRTKIQPVSFETFSEREFRDSFVDGAEIFLLPDGVYGVPIFADPLVLYWNRDIFSSSGLARPPTTWEQLVNETVPALTRKDDQFNITQSAISLGEVSNINNAKRILGMLLLQSGSDLVRINDQGMFSVELNTPVNNRTLSGNAALSFYTQFANPTDENYTWNRALKNDRLMFLGGELGMYIGRASELPELEKANPNLNFDAVVIPQGSGATIQRNYADFYAFAIPKASDNKSGAYAAARYIAGEEHASAFAEALHRVPVLRALIARGASDSFRQRFFEAVLVARGWLDPSPERSTTIFRDMVQDITSQKASVESAVRDATGKLRLLFN